MYHVMAGSSTRSIFSVAVSYTLSRSLRSEVVVSEFEIQRLTLLVQQTDLTSDEREKGQTISKIFFVIYRQKAK
ncbi:unnamed protein product [Calypogeia fissa]